ncbi:MAG: putative transcription regulator AbrB/SpoV [Candidatus Nitrosotenuis sp.]|nr:putative transcription regulator AbrB/SpoV [Candidatus Nitrosotenuis sp.]
MKGRHVNQILSRPNETTFISKNFLTNGMASASPLEIRTIKVSQKGQVSIPTDIRKTMKIKKGDNLVMIVKGRKIVLEKSENIALLLDGEFRDVKAFTEKTLKKIWLNKHDEKWNKYAKKMPK